MTRLRMEREIIEARYPFYDDDMKALIAKVRAAHRGKPDVDEHIIDAVWAEYQGEFRERNIEASRGNATSFAAASRGELTQAGRVAISRAFDELRDFIDDTAELSDSDLAARHDDIYGKAEATRSARRRLKGSQADFFAFFSRTSADADFGHWCVLPVWSAEEATALSFGKEPRRVNVATLRDYTCVNGSPFRDDFMARLDALERELKAGKPSEMLSPEKFFDWAARTGIEMPAALSNEYKRRKEAAPRVDGDSDIHGKRLHMYYKIVLGLSAKHYGLDVTLNPDEEQPGVYSAFSRDLSDRNADVNAKTLRAIVREALTWAQDPQQPLVEHAMRKKLARKGGRTQPHESK